MCSSDLDGAQTTAPKDAQMKVSKSFRIQWKRLSMKVMEVLYASLFKNVDKRIEKEYTLIDKVFF